jgi:ELWxxDGT repeat protein
MLKISAILPVFTLSASMISNIAAHLRRLPQLARSLGGAVLLVAPLASVAGTVQLVRNINTTIIPQSSSPAPLGGLGGKMLFGATDATGPALWSTDGTAAGTQVLARLTGLGILPNTPWNDFLIQGSRTYIVSADASGSSSLWITDGTAGGTSRIITLPGGSTATPVLEGLLNTTLIFSNVDTSLVGQLYTTDGTPAGTHQLTTFTAQTGGFLNGFFVAGNKFYFVASDPSYNRSIWVSDGTVAGTHQISSNTSSVTAAAVYNPQGFTLVGNLVLYGSSGLLWSIDTTTDAISNVITSSGIAGFGPPTLQGAVLANMAGFVLFLGGSGIGVQNSLELWRSDGTTAGTSMVTTVTANATQNELAYPVFEKVGNKVVYIADDGVNGPQLWSSDGTLANTVRLTSATAPPTAFQVASPLSVIGGIAYFAISDGASSTTSSVWRTDGTVAGTQRVGGLPSIDVGEVGATRIAGDANTIYFGIYPTLGAPASVYRYLPASNTSNLAKAGLQLTGTDEFAFNNGLLFFSVNDPTIGDEPWVSNGTAAGTRLIEDINPQLADNGSSPDSFVNFGGRLAFAADDGAAGRELWISDGTAGGTTLLADINPGAASSDPNHLFTANGALYFFATDASGSSKFMRLAGVGASVQVLATLSPQATNVSSYCGSDGAVAIGAKIYFAANDGQSGLELWTSDGTVQGTHRVADIAAGPADAYPCYLTALNGRVYFSAIGPQGNELWSSDGTSAGTVQVADIAPGIASSNPYDLMVLNGELYFAADDVLHGIELWKSDGSAAGTALAADTVPGANGSGPSLQGILNGRLLLQIFLASAAHPGSYVSELWNSDGTPGGTQEIGNLFFTASPSAFINGNHVFLGAQDTAGVTPWVSDGTSGGTHPLTPPGNSTLFWFDDFSGITLFEVPDPTKGAQLWRTDGTTPGTKLVSVEPSVTNTPFSASARQRLTVGQQFFFAAQDPILGMELYALTNTPPVAAADSSTSTNDAAVTIDVLANDTDSDGSLDPTTIVITTNPAHGSAVVNAGKVIYTPSTGFSGTDSFAYTVKDNQGATSAPATVTVTVTAAVAAPPSHGGGGAFAVFQLLGLMLLLAAHSLRARCIGPN